MTVTDRERFIDAMRNGDKETFLELLPHITMSPKGVLKILLLI